MIFITISPRDRITIPPSALITISPSARITALNLFTRPFKILSTYVYFLRISLLASNHLNARKQKKKLNCVKKVIKSQKIYKNIEHWVDKCNHDRYN